MFPIYSSAPAATWAAYVFILLGVVEQEQRPSGSGDQETIVVRAGCLNSESKRAFNTCATSASNAR